MKKPKPAKHWGAIISLSEDGYSRGAEGYRCDPCTHTALAERARKLKAGG